MTAGPPAEESYADVALGFQFGCALTDDNFVRCWGNDDSQQVSLAPENTPADALAAGGEFACEFEVTFVGFFQSFRKAQELT